jgi:hypothetical protein
MVIAIHAFKQQFRVGFVGLLHLPRTAGNLHTAEVSYESDLCSADVFEFAFRRFQSGL